MDGTAKRKLAPVGKIFVAVGAIVLCIGIYQAVQNLIVLWTWKPVQAELMDVNISNDKVRQTIETARADNYLVTWTFRYEIAGATHTATTNPGTHGTYGEMIKWMQRFAGGERLTIHYQPDNPEVISAAAYDWITFSHAARTSAWGIGIAIVGFLMWRISRG